MEVSYFVSPLQPSASSIPFLRLSFFPFHVCYSPPRASFSMSEKAGREINIAQQKVRLVGSVHFLLYSSFIPYITIGFWMWTFCIECNQMHHWYFKDSDKIEMVKRNDVNGIRFYLYHNWCKNEMNVVCFWSVYSCLCIEECLILCT